MDRKCRGIDWADCLALSRTMLAPAWWPVVSQAAVCGGKRGGGGKVWNQDTSGSCLSHPHMKDGALENKRSHKLFNIYDFKRKSVPTKALNVKTQFIIWHLNYPLDGHNCVILHDLNVIVSKLRKPHGPEVWSHMWLLSIHCGSLALTKMLSIWVKSGFTVCACVAIYVQIFDIKYGKRFDVLSLVYYSKMCKARICIFCCTTVFCCC